MLVGDKWPQNCAVHPNKAFPFPESPGCAVRYAVSESVQVSAGGAVGGSRLAPELAAQCIDVGDVEATDLAGRFDMAVD
jgi:hypothetical protein